MSHPKDKASMVKSILLKDMLLFVLKHVISAVVEHCINEYSVKIANNVSKLFFSSTLQFPWEVFWCCVRFNDRTFGCLQSSSISSLHCCPRRLWRRWFLGTYNFKGTGNYWYKKIVVSIKNLQTIALSKERNFHHSDKRVTFHNFREYNISRNSSLWSNVVFEKEVISHSNIKRLIYIWNLMILHLRAHKLVQQVFFFLSLFSTNFGDQLSSNSIVCKSHVCVHKGTQWNTRAQLHRTAKALDTFGNCQRQGFVYPNICILKLVKIGLNWSSKLQANSERKTPLLHNVLSGRNKRLHSRSLLLLEK